MSLRRRAFAAALGGGNTNGFTGTFPELPSKWLELPREALPGIARVAVALTPKKVPNLAWVLDRLRVAAASLHMTLRVVEVSEAERPQKRSLVVNQRAVHALGLTMPKAFLLRVDEVIE